jgi:hypothetical protein
LFERNKAFSFGKGGNEPFKLFKLKSHTFSKFGFIVGNVFGNCPLSLLCETFKYSKLDDKFQNHLGNESEIPL